MSNFFVSNLAAEEFPNNQHLRFTTTCLSKFCKKKKSQFFFSQADKNSVYVNTSKKFLSIICLQLLYWIFQLLRHSNYQRRMVDYSCNHIERDLFAVQL